MSESLSNDKLRYLIIDLLKKKEEEDGHNPEISRPDMLQKLQIPEKLLDNTMYRLKREGLIEFPVTSSEGWQFAKISEYAQQSLRSKNFSFVNNTVNVQGHNIGSIIQTGNNSTINFSQSVSDAFNQAYQIIEAKSDISAKQKEEVRNNTKLLEEELQKIDKDAGKIQRFWKWIKQNANWLIPTLAQVVTDGLKIACGIP